MIRHAISGVVAFFVCCAAQADVEICLQNNANTTIQVCETGFNKCISAPGKTGNINNCMTAGVTTGISVYAAVKASGPLAFIMPLQLQLIDNSCQVAFRIFDDALLCPSFDSWSAYKANPYVAFGGPSVSTSVVAQGFTIEYVAYYDRHNLDLQNVTVLVTD